MGTLITRPHDGTKMLTHIQNKVDYLLWGKKLEALNTFQVFLIQTLRIFYATGRDLRGGLPSLRATGLVYTTLLSMVPLLAVSFSVLKGFGAHNQLEPALINLLEPLGEKGLQVSMQIITFVDNMKVGVLGSLGLLLLIFTVLSLVKKIENAFNHTWHIEVTRNIIQRFSNYLSVILIGPLLLFTAAGLSASFNTSLVVDQLLSIEPFGTVLLIIGESIPYILTAITFTMIYILIPNTKVNFKSALFGGVVTTILWKIVGAFFTLFIVDSTNYTAIYSTFAILIIFMLWIYSSWLIILTGAAIAYYHQNPEYTKAQSQIVRLSCRLREKLALTIMQLIASSFHNNKAAWTTKKLAKKIGISEQSIIMICSALLTNKLLTRTGENNDNYLPSQSLENISLDMILNTARSAEETSLLLPENIESVQAVNNVVTAIDSAIFESAKGMSLKDLT